MTTGGGSGTGGSDGNGGTGGAGGSSGMAGAGANGGATDAGGSSGGGAGTPSAPLADGFKQHQLNGAIGLGYYTACHVMTDNGIRCFGDRHPRTMPPAGLKTSQLACGHDGCCALMPKEAGARIRCWSDKRTIFPPDAVARAVDPIWLAIGYQHGCALNADQSVTCWGQPGTMNTPPPGLKAKQLHVAAYFNCAVKLDDSVACWGINPPTPPADLKAKLVAGIFHGGGHLGAEAQMGTRHACAIQMDDTVRCWGDNVGGTTDVPANLGPVRDVAGSTYSTCAVKPDGEVICWGTRKLFDDPARDKAMPGGLKLKSIRGNFAAYCGRQQDDTLVCWGDEKTSHLSVPPERSCSCRCDVTAQRRIAFVHIRSEPRFARRGNATLVSKRAHWNDWASPPMPTVLIIDDEPRFLDALVALLTDGGYQVDCASDGKQGLARLTRKPPDLVLLDFMMPVLDGPGVLQALRRMPRLRRVPVVMMSAVDEAIVRRRCSWSRGVPAQAVRGRPADAGAAPVADPRRGLRQPLERSEHRGRPGKIGVASVAVCRSADKNLHTCTHTSTSD